MVAAAPDPSCGLPGVRRAESLDLHTTVQRAQSGGATPLSTRAVRRLLCRHARVLGVDRRDSRHRVLPRVARARARGYAARPRQPALTTATALSVQHAAIDFDV